MRALAAALLAVILIASPVAAMSWPAHSFSPTAEYRLELLIKREHRRACDRGVYRNDKLKEAARWRSRDMVKRDYFAHRVKGTSKYVWDYFGRWDISYKRVAEIIAWNTYSDNQSADVAFKGFMGSPIHRSIIRDCRYTRLGAGAYQGGGSKHMFTVIFIRP